MTTHYFVDEAGDDTIFNRKGRVIIGNEGNSRFFMMGLLQIENFISLKTDLDALRTLIVKDPYYKNIPSLQPERRKTAIAFHAKDDLPEIRREVYRLLIGRNDIRFFAVIGDKFSTLNYIRHMEQKDSSFHYKQNDMYDYLLRRLFRDRVATADNYSIVFAERGNRNRTSALKEQVEIAQKRHNEKFENSKCPPFSVTSGKPENYAGLQAVDYYLWALQRLFEKKEERFLLSIWHQCRLIIDMDDVRRNQYGEYYYRKNPLNLDALIGRLKQ